MRIFIIILKYLVPLDVISLHRDAHLKFLDQYYAKGLLLASGHKTTNGGGVIIAISNNREEIDDFVKLDPFAIENLAEYAVHEFSPNRGHKNLKEIIEDAL